VFWHLHQHQWYYNIVLTSAVTLIPFSTGLKRPAGNRVSTRHAAPTVFFLIQRHCHITQMTVHFLLNSTGSGVPENSNKPRSNL